MRDRILIIVLFLIAMVPIGFMAPRVQMAKAQTPFTLYPNFGDYTNARPMPVGPATLTGVYRTGQNTNWVQAGVITCNHCWLLFGGSATFNNTFTVAPGVEGNAAPTASDLISSGSSTGSWRSGFGPGGGDGWVVNNSNFSGACGGSHGGAGGVGGVSGSPVLGVAQTYSIDGPLYGSSGGGPLTGGVSGAGGGSLYIEAVGNVHFTSGATVTANGGNSTTNGAGGSGGGIQVKSLANIIADTGAAITAGGGTGVGEGGAGGGGIIEFEPGPTGSFSGGGTITAPGGTASGGGSNGSAGVVTTSAPWTGARVGK